MLSEQTPWIKDGDTEVSFIEFLVRDFYGPLVVFRLEKHGDVEPIKAVPIERRVESVECDVLDAIVFDMAQKELEEVFGKVEIARS